MTSKSKPTEIELLIEIRDTIKSVNIVLQEILRWTRFANISKLRETLLTELDSDEKKLAYDNSDGEKSLKEIAKISSAPTQTIHNWWQKWLHLGLVVESEKYKGRMKKIISLEDVGIKVPLKITTQTHPDQKN